MNQLPTNLEQAKCAIRSYLFPQTIVCTKTPSLSSSFSRFWSVVSEQLPEGCNSGITPVPNPWRWKVGTCGPSQRGQGIQTEEMQEKGKKDNDGQKLNSPHGTFKPKISIVPAPDGWRMACLLSAETKQQSGTTV